MDIEKIIQENNHNPEEIGIAILKSMGYKVEVYNINGEHSIFVHDKDGNKILYFN